MQLTENFTCYVTKDGAHFALLNSSNASVDGGYSFGERAQFEDNGRTYSVTILGSTGSNSYAVDLNQL